MDFSDPPRPHSESVLPMINVVFLLLIFFLLAAEIAPTEPFTVNPPPGAASERSEGATILHLAADGRLAFGGAAGAAAVAAAAAAANGTPVRLRADRETDGATLARTLAGLAEAGAVRVDLVTVPR
jgi:biopolymer transport protein ExbD